MRRLALSALSAALLAISVGISPAAYADNSAQANAKAAADSAVNGYMSGLCASQGPAGWLAKRSVYFDSCFAADGFQYFVYATAAKSFNAKAASADALKRLADYCQSGVVYSTGIKGKVVEFHAGTGGSETLARVSRDLAANSEKGANGYASATVCGTSTPQTPTVNPNNDADFSRFCLEVNRVAGENPVVPADVIAVLSEVGGVQLSNAAKIRGPNAVALATQYLQPLKSLCAFRTTGTFPP